MLVRILNSKLDEKEVHNVQISLIFKNRIFKIDKQALVNIRPFQSFGIHLHDSKVSFGLDKFILEFKN